MFSFLIKFSSYNKKEIDEVKRTIKNLLPPNSTRNRLRQINQIDIGVVTPYRKQSQMLVKEFRYFNFDQILVGTAEIFQGKEKPIMIVSTVRSSGSGLGFVAEWRVCIFFSILFYLNLKFPS